MNHYIDDVQNFHPSCEQEEADRRAMLAFISRNPDVLLRENEAAHFTASSLIFNQTMDKVLMIYHNIYQNWCWTGGHADGDGDLLHVALKEAGEETSVPGLQVLTPEAVALDIISVPRHYKNGVFVPTHLHYNLTYALQADDRGSVSPKLDENSGVKWIPLCELQACTAAEPEMFVIYDKIIRRTFALLGI